MKFKLIIKSFSVYQCHDDDDGDKLVHKGTSYNIVHTNKGVRWPTFVNCIKRTMHIANGNV
jgi:hypothetical protein